MEKNYVYILIFKLSPYFSVFPNIHCIINDLVVPFMLWKAFNILNQVTDILCYILSLKNTKWYFVAYAAYWHSVKFLNFHDIQKSLQNCFSSIFNTFQIWKVFMTSTCLPVHSHSCSHKLSSNDLKLMCVFQVVNDVFRIKNSVLWANSLCSGETQRYSDDCVFWTEVT